jgi:hypothetical protein
LRVKERSAISGQLSASQRSRTNIEQETTESPLLDKEALFDYSLIYNNFEAMCKSGTDELRLRVFRLIADRLKLQASGGGIAQLGEHSVRNAGVEGSNPFASTNKI